MEEIKIEVPDLFGDKPATANMFDGEGTPPEAELDAPEEVYPQPAKVKVAKEPKEAKNPYLEPPQPFRVHRYVIKFDAVTTISLPVGAEVLSAQTQLQPGGERLSIWAKVPVDPDVDTEVRSFAAIGTGAQKHFAIKQFIDTVQFNHGNYVCHVFEVK